MLRGYLCFWRRSVRGRHRANVVLAHDGFGGRRTVSVAGTGMRPLRCRSWVGECVRATASTPTATASSTRRHRVSTCSRAGVTPSISTLARRPRPGERYRRLRLEVDGLRRQRRGDDDGLPPHFAAAIARSVRMSSRSDGRRSLDGREAADEGERKRLATDWSCRLATRAASGEGNPIVAAGNQSPRAMGRRLDRRGEAVCHRSTTAGPSLAAQSLKREDHHSSITFLHLACSGADMGKDAGVDGGRARPVHRRRARKRPTRLLPPQVEQLESTV